MSATTFLWIPLLPLAAFPVLLWAGRRLPRGGDWLGTLAVGGSWVLALVAFGHALSTGDHEPVRAMVPWIQAGQVNFSMGILVDGLTIVMLVVVTTVSFLVHVYSMGYMHGDSGYPRYYAYLSFFTASMLWLVLADNLLGVFIGWELVGLCSYLLIGFWYEKPEAAAAGRKAFLTTKVGDLGFFLGIMLLLVSAGTLHIESIHEKIAEGALASGVVTLSALLIFCGAVGKSAQFPLHVWLPDAMEGPTPVSALIHAATMVAAGVYLVARMYGVFVPSSVALSVVAWIGAITALMAATIAVVTHDIKRILAYSTLSQLGYMMLALGVGGYTAGMFHLTTHAFFKALLFLGAGSVIHGMGGIQNIWQMGGLRKAMPITAWTFLIASLAIAGIPPLSGFFSKDEILLAAYHQNLLIYAIGTFVAFLTAFYMFRLWFVVFLGTPEAEHTSGLHGASGHAHESPWTMTVPLLVLAVLSIISGGALLGSFRHLVHWPGLHGGGHHEPSMFVAGMSVAVAVAGIVIAWLVYVKHAVSANALRERAGTLYQWVSNKYYVDEVYERVVLGTVQFFSKVFAACDKYVIDGLLVDGTAWLTTWLSRLKYRVIDTLIIDDLGVNGTAWVVQRGGAVLRVVQTGFVQHYLLVIAVGLAVLLMVQ